MKSVACWLGCFLAMSAGENSHAQANCQTAGVQGLYGLTTQALGEAGIEGTTLSLFQFDGQGSVDETYYVNTANKSWRARALGDYSVASDCRFSLQVKNPDGSLYALEGRLNPADFSVNVIQTLPDNPLVSVGTLQRIGFKSCKTRNFLGRYAFLSQGRVPSSSSSSGAKVPQSRVGWFFADGEALQQPVEWVNSNGSVSETPPTQIPSETLETCLLNIDNGGFAGVIVDRGRKILYMDLAAGSYRLGVMQKVP